MTHRSLTVEKLAEFNLKNMPAPQRGFTSRLDRGQMSEADFERVIDVLGQETEEIRGLVRKIGLPDDMASHPLYPPFLTGEFPDKTDPMPPEKGQAPKSIIPNESPLLISRNILLFVPLHPDIEGVIKFLRRIAGHIVETIKQTQMTAEDRTADTWTQDTLEQAIQSTANGLLRILDDNVRAMDEHGVIRRTDYEEEEVPREKQRSNDPEIQRFLNRMSVSEKLEQEQIEGLRGISFIELRRVGKAILKQLKPKMKKLEDRRNNDPAKLRTKRYTLLCEANIKLMQDLGLLPKTLFEENKEKFLNEEMPSCLSRGKELYHSIVESLRSAQKIFQIPGMQLQEVDLFAENGYRTPIELLQVILKFAREPESYKSGDLQELSEAQTLLGLSYYFLYVRRHPYYLAARAEEFEFSRMLVENLFTKITDKDEVEVPLDNRGNVIFNGDKEATNTKKIKLRTLEAPDMPDQFQPLRIYFDKTDRKKARAIVKKLMTNPNFEMNRDIFDFLRSRVFLWDITFEEFMQSPQKKEIRKRIETVAKAVGETLELEFVNKRRENLDPGEFCIEDKLEANIKNHKSKRFPAMKVYGRTQQGYHVEFQIVLRNGYNSIHSPDSPNNPQFYELLKDIEMAKIIFPSSVFPEIHELARKILEELEKRSKVWFKEHPQDVEIVGLESLK